ncbi:MAG: xanthine dehydrogenase family protein molybdopterin-binding subunit [Actinomycetota bacterium]
MAVQTSGLGFVGQSVKRVEDERLLIGAGRYVADVRPEGGLHAAFVRSPIAHGRIVSIDTSEAEALDGVVAVFTGADIVERTNPFVPMLMLPGMYTPLFWAMSDERVRHVGDPVALVVAESRALAEDGAELVVVDYDDLPAVPDMATAMQSHTPQLWEKANGNVLLEAVDTYGEVDQVFARADRVITETFRCQRQANQPMETRGTVVEVDADTGHLTITSATQAPHFLKWAAAALTTKQTARESGQALRGMRERLDAFRSGAGSFFGDNQESLQSQDNRGMVSQLRRDRSLLKHLPGMALGVLSSEDFPTVVCQDIGGGFGSKGSTPREEIAVVAAAKALGRTIQWIEDRVENLLDGGQAREEEFTISMAVDDDGTLRGMRVEADIDHGAYPGFPVGAGITKSMQKVYFPGMYRWEAYEMRSRIIATNKGKHIPYRGPWANETWVRERMLDVVARELGMTPVELRQQNMMGAEDFPTRMVTGPTLDETASTRATLVRALELLDHDQIAQWRAEADAAGRKLGVGIACYHEAAPGPPDFFEALSPGSDLFAQEEAKATVDADGTITVFTSQSPHGQSHETTYAQVAADEFGVDIGDIRVVWGDTDTTRFSFLGTGGSRGGPIGGGAIRKTSRSLREQVVSQAATMLEADPADVTITGGVIHVAGVPSRGLSYAEVAGAAAADQGIGDGAVFEAVESYAGKGDGGWSCATHVAVVDVDLATGQVAIPRYLVVEDCGPIINPAIVEGQVRGGVAQGIGAVFYEHAAYDGDGNMIATTYLDYLVPTSTEIPHIEIDHLETLTPGENDFRGVGEGGMIGSPAALTNAVEDALASLGAEVRDQYLPPSKILELAGVIEPEE